MSSLSFVSQAVQRIYCYLKFLPLSRKSCCFLWVLAAGYWYTRSTIQHPEAAPSLAPARALLSNSTQGIQKKPFQKAPPASAREVRHLQVQPRTIPPPPLPSSCSTPAPPSFAGRSSGAVFTRSASLGRHSLNPQRLVVGLPLHLQGNSIHTLSALDSSLLAAR